MLILIEDARIRAETEVTMKQRNWDCTLGGTGAGDVTWRWAGACTAADEAGARDLAKRLAFQAITDGRAVFGRPGEAGCKGPYKITTFDVVERIAT